MAEAAIAALEPSPGSDRSIRISRLLIKSGTKIIRGYFDFIHKPKDLPNAFKIHRGKLEQLLKRRILTNVEWNKRLFPSPGLCGASKDFDFTLLFKLLRNICNLTEPSTGWDKLPDDTDLSKEADLARLKYHRNETCAHSEMELSEDEFNDCWEPIKDALVGILAIYSDSAAKVEKYRKQIDKSRTSPITLQDRNIHLSQFPVLIVKGNIYIEISKAAGSSIVQDVWECYKRDIPSLRNAIQDLFPDDRIIVEDVNEGSVIIQIRVTNFDALEEFWKRYKTGKLINDLEEVLFTKEIRRLGDEVEVLLRVHVSEDEYLHARHFLEELIPFTRKKAIASEAEKEVEKVTERIEELSLDIIHGQVITDRKSKFQAHFAEVTSKEQADQVLSKIRKNIRYAEATNTIWASRIEAEKGSVVLHSDDGGEYLAGRRLEHLLNEINVVNVVIIVTCWDGDVYLGLDKFKNINESALDVLTSHGMTPTKTRDEVWLFLEKMEDYFEALKQKAFVAHALMAEAAKQTVPPEFDVIHSKTITVPKSSFQGHLARVTSQDEVEQVLAQLKEDRKIANARFNMVAYRIYDEKKKQYLEEGRDDGEAKAGQRILHLMQVSEVENAVVIVTRWKESEHVKLGTDRFKHINACATEVISMASERGWLETKTSGVEPKESKKKSKSKSTKK